MTAASDQPVDPIDTKAEKPLQDLPVPEQEGAEIVGGATLLEQTQMENVTFLSISNVLRTQRDVAQNSISNIR